MLVSILHQGDFLIASIHTALDDTELLAFQRDLVDEIGVSRSRGVVIDLAALDVLDSFGARSLRNLAHMARLRGAHTVLVGIQPDVAYTIVELGMHVDVYSALDLEEGLSYLEGITGGRRLGSSGVGLITGRS